MPKRLITR